MCRNVARTPALPGPVMSRAAPNSSRANSSDEAALRLWHSSPMRRPRAISGLSGTPPVLALVEVAERDVAVDVVADHEHRHRRGVDAGQGPDRAVVVAPADRDLTAVEGGDRLVAGGREPLEQGAADDRLALPAGVL